jgi:hypothetical protein
MGGSMNQDIDETPGYARIFVDRLKEAGVGLVTALPESLLESVTGCAPRTPTSATTRRGSAPALMSSAPRR